MSGKAAKISLIVPVYNVERYLERCMDSCARQTLLDLEILCVNDGSTDGSGRILERYAAMDCRFRILNRENGGVSSARNAGLDAADGEWIMFLDADDYLEPDACERVWTESLEEETDIITFGGTFFPDAPETEKNRWLYQPLQPNRVRYRSFRAQELLSEPGVLPFVWQHAYSAAFLERSGVRFDESLHMGEDILFIASALPLAERFSFLPDALYHYRAGREGSLTEGVHVTMASNAQWRLTTAELILATWERYGIAGRYRQQLGDLTVRLTADTIAKLDGPERADYAGRLSDLLERYDLGSVLKDLPTVRRKKVRAILRGRMPARRGGTEKGSGTGRRSVG